MANSYTTTDLVTNIKLIGHVPTGNSTFTTSDLITLSDREIQTPIIKQILSTRGGYYLTYTDYSITSDGLYSIPADCIAGVLANVELVQNTTIIPVNIIEESEQFCTISPTSTSYGCFMKGNYVQILPLPNLGVARLWYFKRPSKLIPTSQAAQVTAVNGAVLTVSSVPSNITNGASVDVLGDQPPFHILGEKTITSIVGTDITLDSSVTGVAVGDWIALSNQTPVPQIPVEFRPLLEQRVVSKIYELQGYLEKMKASDEKLKELENDTFSLISPRIKSQTKIINPVNGGFLAGNVNRMTNFPAPR
jgi:hypothetical protein